MIRIAITEAAYDAICATLPLGSMVYETEANERGERYVLAGGRDVGSARGDARAGRVV